MEKTIQPDIRLVSPSLAGGGSERVCLRLANQWARDGKNVELLLIRDDGPYRRFLDSRVVTKFAHCTRIRHSLPWLVRQLWRHPRIPTLVFGPDIGAAMGLLKRARLVSTPIIYREWGLPEARIRVLTRWIYHELISSVDGVVAQTKFVAASLRRLGIKYIPITAIPNPIDFENELDGRSRGLDGMSPKPVRVLMVGRLVPVKRVDRLLHALAIWQQQGGNFYLKIVGDGSLRPQLDTLAQSLDIGGKVDFLGWNDAVGPLYRAADLFVLSSAHEGMPNALLEAILSGCRVLSSGGGGVRELFGELGLNECYLEEDDFGTGFGRKVEAVLTMPACRWREARQKLVAMTDMQQVAERYFDFCEQVASQERLVT